MTDLAIKLNGTYINVDGAHGNQCWDSAARIAQLLGLPVINTHGEGRWPGWAGNMWDAFPQSPEIDAAYYRVGPDQAGQPGDTAIWGDSDPYYPATHVATVIRDFDAQLLCLSQNSSAARPDLPGYSPHSTGPTIMQHLPKGGLLGYLRPRTGLAAQGTITEQDDDMALTDKQANALDFVADNLPRMKEILDALDERTGNSNSGTLKKAADLVLRKINPTDWADGSPMYIAAQADIDGLKNAGPTKYFKGDDPADQTVYENVHGRLRGLAYDEWEVEKAKGERDPLILPQEMIDTFPKAGS
jgi:hypothetical protein